MPHLASENELIFLVWMEKSFIRNSSKATENSDHFKLNRQRSKGFSCHRELLNISFILAAVSCQDSWVIYIPSTLGHARINPEHGAVYKFENP